MKHYILLLIIAGTITGARAADINVDSLFNTTNELYKENGFSEALDNYLAIEEEGYHSAELYLNIGNCYYKLADYPHAILYYERAKLLDPRNEKITFNLAKARTYIIDNIEEIPELFLARWIRNFINILDSNHWAVICLITFVFCWISFLLYFLSGKLNLKRLGFYIGLLLLIISGLTFFNSYKAKMYQTSSNSAIIIYPTVTVKGSPSEEGVNVFIIHEGTKVFITDEVSDWYEIKLTDGKQGWLRKEIIEII